MISTVTATRVVNVRFSTAFTFYIGRGNPRYGLQRSIWANDHRIGKDCTREQALARYLEDLERKPWLMQRLSELRGEVLGCWCAPPEGLTASDPLICHGQILARLVDALPD